MTFQPFIHPRLGIILLTGCICKAPTPPYFLQIIIAETGKTSCIPLYDLENCLPTMPEFDEETHCTTKEWIRIMDMWDEFLDMTT